MSLSSIEIHSSGKAMFRVDGGTCTITNYHQAAPFSSFFPGIAGELGIPMWIFYVNRGQGVCSMGTRDKHHPIMEYMPANRAYQLTGTQGFRTFIRGGSSDGTLFYEPFQQRLEDLGHERVQRFIITADGLSLEEENASLGLAFRVEYVPLCQQPCAGLARVLTVSDLLGRERRLELVDGLPLLVPAGVSNDSLQHMRRTIEAFVRVDNLDEGMPYFRVKVEPADRPDVQTIREGHFYAAFEDGGGGETLSPLQVLVDPWRLFASRRDYLYPEGFLMGDLSALHQGQMRENRLPCAMAVSQFTLPAHGRHRVVSYVGHAESLDLCRALATRFQERAYVEDLARINGDLVQRLTQPGFLCSSNDTLDAYARQNMLDNGMRGGFPITLKGKCASSTLHLFSRKHGDLERDYNDFQLACTPFAQGNGNYRDVNQNRRCDNWINPLVGQANLVHFLGLIQLDGYNPLVVKETTFLPENHQALTELLALHVEPQAMDEVKGLLAEAFTPGQLAIQLRKANLVRAENLEAFLGDVLAQCRRIRQSEHGEGYWTDHWSYNLDLVENYLSIYPEETRELFFQGPLLGWHDSAHVVLPRHRRYLVWEGRPMQLDAVVLDPEKEAMLRGRLGREAGARRGRGQGELLLSTLLVKFLCLVANKMATLDPDGVGVEMEAGKPNWYDALNGLPGLMGSSLNESLAVKRHAQFLLDVLETHGQPGEHILVFEELWDFLKQLEGLLSQDLAPQAYWELASTAREHYRERTRLGVADQDLPLSVDWVKSFLWDALRKLNQGIAKAWDPDSGLLRSYFTHEVTKHELVDATEAPGTLGMPVGNQRGLPAFRVLSFRTHALPLFLEGQVHFLRCRPTAAQALDVLRRLEESPLYDQALGMFKVNAPLEGESLDIGRARAFAPGWFENESIWLHMHYKLLLELLRCGLPEDFHRHLRQAGIPFLDPAVYGRSTLENSSFLVSSAHPDATLHGQGFVARLSGATAEFIHMWLWACAGPAPFSINSQGDLQLDLQPVLTGELFTRKGQRRRLWLDGAWEELDFPANSLSFMFLGHLLVTYLNPARGDSFGPEALSPVEWVLESSDGSLGPTLLQAPTGPLAHQVRAGEYRRLWVTLGVNPKAGQS